MFLFLWLRLLCIAPAREGKVDKRLGAASAAVLTKWASWSLGPVAAAAAASVVVQGKR